MRRFRNILIVILYWQLACTDNFIFDYRKADHEHFNFAGPTYPVAVPRGDLGGPWLPPDWLPQFCA